MLQKIGFAPGFNKQVTETTAEGQWVGGDLWPIFIEETKVLLEVGDMLVYSGCELEHWREPFDGNICGQVFLHYNHVNGQFAEKNKFDGRPMLGLPSFLK